MNVRRGMFRLWVIFATLFVLGVVIFSYEHIRYEFQMAQDFAGLPHVRNTGTKMPLSEQRRSQLDAIVQRMQANGETDDYIQAVVNDFKNKYANESAITPAVGEFMPVTAIQPWTKLMETAGVALGVPLAALVLGWSLIWAFSGFRIPAKADTSPVEPPSNP